MPKTARFLDWLLRRSTADTFDARDRALANLLDLGDLLASHDKYEDRMTALCTWGAKLIDCDRVSIFLRDDRQYHGAFNYGNPPEVARHFHQHRVALSDPLIAQVMASGSRLTVNDTLTNPLFNTDVAQRAGIRAMVVQMLWHSDHTPAGFITAEYNQRQRTFEDLQATMLDGVARVTQTILQSHLLGQAHNQSLMDSEALQARMRALERNESLGQLAGGVAHDFNNLLAVIIGNAELLESLVTDAGAGPLAAIQAAGNHAADLTSRLLRFSRNQLPVPVVFDLSEVVEDIAPLVNRSIGEAVTLKQYLARGCHVLLERPQAEQILLNLAMNARDAMPNGGVLSITTSIRHLEQHQASPLDIVPGAYSSLLVTDTGPGIPEHLLPQIFQPFVSGSPEQDHPTQNGHSGLGLATVFQIVSAAGGVVHARNASTGGARFEVLMPLREPPSDAAPDQPDDAADLPRGSASILVVDDNQPLLTVLAQQLRSLGYRITSCQQPEDALHLLTIAGPFDLVLSDVLMPGLTGPQLANKVWLHNPQQRFLFMSAYAGNNITLDPALQVQAPLLQKPFGKATLARQVHATLTDIGDTVARASGQQEAS